MVTSTGYSSSRSGSNSHHNHLQLQSWEIQHPFLVQDTAHTWCRDIHRGKTPIPIKLNSSQKADHSKVLFGQSSTRNFPQVVHLLLRRLCLFSLSTLQNENRLSAIFRNVYRFSNQNTISVHSIVISPSFQPMPLLIKVWRSVQQLL